MTFITLASVGVQSLAYNPCSCPDSRPKKEPRDSDRDISGFLDKGSYVSKAKGPGATSHHGQQTAGRAWQQSTEERRGLPFIEGIDFRLAH